MQRTFLVLLLAATACATSPFDAPYAVIQVDPLRAADPNVIPVVINRVDGRTPTELHRAVVAPGRHQVTVDVPPRRGFHLATQQTFEMAVEPCTRYYIAARLETPVGQEWKPLVRSSERIGECDAKFRGAR